jgi:Na(+)-translocating NADH:ubiquinone oxidoreductase A subunit
MKFVGGYDLPLEGRPSVETKKLQEPEVLFLPLFSRSFDYTALQVENGESVTEGQILATDPENYFAPLLAPLNGTVNLDAAENHITLENLSSPAAGSFESETTDSDNKAQQLLQLGVWPFIAELRNGRMPDPATTPDDLIIVLARQEPFYPDPEAFLAGKTESFHAGIEQLHRLFDGIKIHLVLPQALSHMGAQLAPPEKGHAGWVNLVEVENRYPSEHPLLVAKMLGLDLDCTWSLEAWVVTAVDQALNHGKANVTRSVAVGGPVIATPCHFQVPIGYPLSSLTASTDMDAPLRIIDGGVLTGRIIGPEQKGLDSETIALTCLEENTKREVLAFAQPGFTKHSFTSTFASVFKPVFKEKYTTALRGEARPCISCGYCEDVCPAELMPHLIYRYLSKDRLEDACRVGLERCVECGLCSFVCLSKIEHLKVFREERRKCEDEKDSRE